MGVPLQRFEADQSYRMRRSTRIAVDRTASLRPETWYDVEVRLRDLSTTGFLVETDDTIPIGSFVMIELPGIGAVHAQVRWQVGGRMGAMFLDPIDLSECEWTTVRISPPDQAA